MKRWSMMWYAAGLLLLIGVWLTAPLARQAHDPVLPEDPKHIKVRQPSPEASGLLKSRRLDDENRVVEITANRLLYTASFTDGDRRHRTSGTARTLSSNGIRYLRFEHFATTRGPALYVFLTEPGARPDSGIALGRLKGIQGNQNYELPAGLDLNVNREIVIFCKTFHIVYGRALLQPEASGT